MLIRQVAKRFAVSLAATAAAGAIVLTAFAGPAGATTPTQGSSVPNSALACSAAGADDSGQGCPYANITGGTPFSSGQQINVVIPATENATDTGPLFNTTEALLVVECSAPNGVIPTSTSACNGDTVGPGSLFANSDGSVNYVDSTGLFYPVYFTPDSALGDTATSPKCGNTSATECILYIGTDFDDFTEPHVWSQPFFVNATAGDSGANPGDGTPEVPLAIMLPLAALAVVGGTVLVRRRRANAHALEPQHS
jgi:hypothetical protein